MRGPSTEADLAKRKRLCNMTAALISFLVIAPIIWLVFDRDPPFIRTSGRLAPESPAPGDWVTVTWQVRQMRKGCVATGRHSLTRTIIDGAGKIADIAPVEGVYTGDVPIVRSFQLPRGLTEGRAKYRATACFVCGHNPFHYVFPVCVSTPELEFTIAPPDLEQRK